MVQTCKHLSKMAKCSARLILQVPICSSSNCHGPRGTVDTRKAGIHWQMLNADRVVAAVKSYPNRVQRIALEGPSYELARFCMANHAYPVLESFDFHPLSRPILTQHSRVLPRVCGLLSRLSLCCTGLVELTLGIDIFICPPPAGLFLAHLQGMPSLRRLFLSVRSYTYPAANGPDTPEGTRKFCPTLKPVTFYFPR
jgi:hypothetical protein